MESTTEPIDILVIIAARRRGVPLRVIASQLGCSFQAVSYRIKAYERRTGQQVRIRAKPDYRARVASVCEQCGRTIWRAPHLVSRYCSTRCYHISTRSLSHEELMRAIETRQSGSTWTHVGNLFDTPFQTIQKRIWLYLMEADLLTRANVNRIWRPATHLFHRDPSWRWLANKYGEPK
jgi:hypothetical protein